MSYGVLSEERDLITSDVAVRIRGLSKSFKVLKTVERSKLNPTIVNRFLNLFLGDTFNPLEKRREIVEIKALDNINFDINRGEILGLFGKNGSGKTTLLSILGTIYPPDHGNINIFGYEYNGCLKEIRNLVIPMFGWLRNVDLSLTARQNIEQNLTLMKMNPSDVNGYIEDVVSFFELNDRIDDRVERFSTGMMIKASLLPFLIAFLASERCLVLCDEPFVGLDLIALKRLREFFLRKRKENYAMVLASHQLMDIMTLCDRIAIIDKGLILAIDTPYRLIKTVAGKEIIYLEFTSTYQPTEEIFMDISGVISCKLYIDATKGKHKADILVSDSRETIPSIINVILKMGNIQTLYIKSPTLEDVLINLTERANA